MTFRSNCMWHMYFIRRLCQYVIYLLEYNKTIAVVVYYRHSEYSSGLCWEWPLRERLLYCFHKAAILPMLLGKILYWYKIFYYTHKDTFSKLVNMLPLILSNHTEVESCRQLNYSPESFQHIQETGCTDTWDMEIHYVYTSVFSSAWLCQQRSWYGVFVRRPSVRRPSVSQLSLNLMHGFLSNLVVASPGPYARTFFEFLKKIVF